jgi:glycerophosphoryl diester phosphodiesterase
VFSLLKAALGVLVVAGVSFPAEPEVTMPLVIAHRGASGYLPEHTLPAKALAHGMRADYIEQDVVLTKDDVPIVLHDIHLDTVTDVSRQFPDRARGDGRYYAIDFTLAEIRSLKAGERFDRKTGQAVYPRRFPVGVGRFQIPTLQEELELIRGLNQSTGRAAGVYPEIKAPAFHRREGRDISRIVLNVLSAAGYTARADAIYVQCFDAAEMRRLREELHTDLNLIQLIGENDWKESTTDYDALRTDDGLRAVAEYADGIGPSLNHIITGIDSRGRPVMSSLVEDAHRHGLAVHPYTLRADALPDYAADFEVLLDLVVHRAGVDGLFTDFPDLAVEFIRRGE